MTATEEMNTMDVQDSDVEIDSDEELQEALAAGLLKPGLNTVVNAKKRILTNNVSGLQAKLGELEKSLPWIERLDMLNKPAPLAPELANEELSHKTQREKVLKLAKRKNIEDDPIHNDFKREMIFYRQAQAAVLEAIPRLRSMGVPTQRPSDYFAQMLKADAHMNKIREKLLSKQVVEERIEKVRKLRELKKYGKQVQVEVQQKRHKEKREMLEEVKKFRKGKIDTLDFLEEGGSGGKKKSKKSSSVDMKNKFKDKKFGFGGKKRGTKMNTKDSTNDFKPPRSGGAKKKGAAAKRPGKLRRQKSGRK
uniref:Probable rRNA-processing protein EBP2 homolog n=1 Tax=Caligus rogercresseyi TaxID=217165 RepID=C1BMH7_CALRO|nr:Probable rRNA-processing protein EBP2 homolog [Caligus rogercresseyi]